MPQPNAMRCLVVDDEPRLRRVLVRLLEGEGFTCLEAGSGVEALEQLEQEPVPLVISDLRMPQMDGVALLRQIMHRWPDTAVVMVTAVAEVESAVACLQLGALDYVGKPFHLEDRVRAQAHRIEELFLGGVQALAQALEAKDAYLKGHSIRVAEYATAIGRQLRLDANALDTLSLGSNLHDIGKIGVSEEVLHKRGALSEEEYRHIMEHPAIGARILGPLLKDYGAIIAIVRSHHERLDGKGLPDGLKGDEIPLLVRAVTVADAFDAMTSERPYRPSLTVERALAELRDGKGVQFDPEVVEAFVRAYPSAQQLPIATPAPRMLR